MALAPAVGGQAEAYRRVFELPSKRFEKFHGWLADPTGDDVWALSFAPKMAPGSPEHLAKPYGWSIGSFERLLSDPANLGFVDGTQLPAADYAKCCGDMAMINLSKIMREIEDRARSAGVHFQSDFAKGEDE